MSDDSTKLPNTNLALMLGTPPEYLTEVSNELTDLTSPEDVPMKSDWHAMSLEVLFNDRPIEQVLRAYDTTIGTFEWLKQNNKEFMLVFQAAQELITSLGASAPVVLRARALASDNLLVLEKLLSDDAVHPSVKLNTHKHLVELGRLAAPKNDIPAAAVAVQINLDPRGFAEKK